MNNILFQYYANGKMILDTDFISQEEADELLSEYREQFELDLADGLEPVLAVWVNNTETSMYQKSSVYWNQESCMVHDGKLWTKI